MSGEMAEQDIDDFITYNDDLFEDEGALDICDICGHFKYYPPCFCHDED